MESRFENRLLDALSEDERARLTAHLHSVTLSLGDVIYEPGERLDHIYFPTISVISLLYTVENGMTAEMGLAGNDGVVGVALLLGGDTTPNRAVAQLAGSAYRMTASMVRQEFARGGRLQSLLLRYTTQKARKQGPEFIEI